MEDADAHTLGGLRRERLGEPLARGVVLKDVVVQVDPALGPGDRLEPVIVSLGTVLEEFEAVPLPKRRVACPGQNPLQARPRDAAYSGIVVFSCMIS